MHHFKALGLLGCSSLANGSLITCRIAPGLQYQQCPAPWADARLPSRSSFNTSSTRTSHTSAGPSSITYRIGAAFSAKGRKFNAKRDLFSFDPGRQSSEKLPFTGRPASGQDAFFVSSLGNTSNVAFGVADGVGGWIDSGAHVEGRLGARELLEQGYKGIVADEDVEAGGSTACVAIGDASGNLEVANLGDSGFIQLRLKAVHHYSNPQTHAFNTPYQLSIVPPKILVRSRIFGGMPLRDYPRDASVTSHEVRHGDVLIFATDGVWDNLSSSEVLRVVDRHMTHLAAWKNGKNGTVVGKHLDALTKAGGIPLQKENLLQIPLEKENSLQQLLAVAITREAKAASENPQRDGPFAREVQKYYPHDEFRGGKVDDICVIVAVAVQTHDTER
ncbi:MAG: hypothetical protein Q9170_006066 [Blastenia crenularia]